jgi:dolichyl-phosphate beta-glucosyltransferase
MAPAVRLVVPCWNEAARLDPPRFLAALDADPGLGLTFVDDGSTDGTRAVLETLARARPDRVSVVALDRNVGKGEAVRAGLLAALALRPAYAGWWDADLSAPLAEVGRLRAALDARPGAFLAMGARVRMLGTTIERRALRHYAGRVVATWISRTLRLHTYDTQCGAKLFRVDAMPAGLLDAPFVTRWLFDVEVLVRLRNAGEIVVEVPLSVWRDVPGSKVRALDFARAWFDLRRLRRRL